MTFGFAPERSHSTSGASIASTSDTARSRRSRSRVERNPTGSSTATRDRSGSSASHDAGLTASGTPTMGASVLCKG